VAEETFSAVVLVEPVEEWSGDVHGVFVVADHGQPAQDDVEAGCFGGVIAFVVEVGFVDDLGDAPQRGIGQLVAVEDGL
jgi:hypothetical protein